MHSVCIGPTLLKVVSYYDLGVPSMSVMGFPKKSFDGGGWEHNSFMLALFNFAKKFYFTFTSSMNAAMAESMTSFESPASSNRFDSFDDFAHCPRMPRILGMTRVSSPHRTSG